MSVAFYETKQIDRGGEATIIPPAYAEPEVITVAAKEKVIPEKIVGYDYKKPSFRLAICVSTFFVVMIFVSRIMFNSRSGKHFGATGKDLALSWLGEAEYEIEL